MARDSSLEDSVKRAILESIEKLAPELELLSRRIHDNPETAFRETEAAAQLEEYLERHGFSVERGLGGLDTAFRAGYGRGEPVIAILAEYDALPGIGHGCGHNIICVSAVAAGIAAQKAVDAFGGMVWVIGTPGEELYGGKALLLERGAFEGVTAAMMVHPSTEDIAASMALACQTLDVEFHGRAAHAAARPEEGINALEAMLLSFNSINSLRQHIRSSARIHGIITDGGEAANIVPAHSAGSFIVRAAEDDYLDDLKVRVIDCFTGAALATGARLEYRWGQARYAAMKNNMTMARLFQRHMGELGRKMRLNARQPFFGSTDMGNVSQVLPGIHPFIAVAPDNILLHSPEFVEAAVSPAGMRGLLDGARAMALTAAELLANPQTLKKVISEFGRKP